MSRQISSSPQPLPSLLLQACGIGSGSAPALPPEPFVLPVVAPPEPFVLPAVAPPEPPASLLEPPELFALELFALELFALELFALELFALELFALELSPEPPDPSLVLPALTTPPEPPPPKPPLEVAVEFSVRPHPMASNPEISTHTTARTPEG
jgi:hypothetical protein